MGNSDLAVLNLKFIYAEIRCRAGRWFGTGFRSRVAEAGEIPFPGAVFYQQDVRVFHGKRAYFELAGEDQGQPLEPDLQRRRLKKCTLIEGRIITDGDVAGFSAAAEKRSLDFPNAHPAPQGRGELAFNLRTEAVHVDEKRHKQNRENDNAQDDAEDNPQTLHKAES